jgi:hypothetical protein
MRSSGWNVKQSKSHVRSAGNATARFSRPPKSDVGGAAVSVSPSSRRRRPTDVWNIADVDELEKSETRETSNCAQVPTQQQQRQQHDGRDGRRIATITEGTAATNTTTTNLVALRATVSDDF